MHSIYLLLEANLKYNHMADIMSHFCHHKPTGCLRNGSLSIFPFGGFTPSLLDRREGVA